MLAIDFLSVPGQTMYPGSERCIEEGFEVTFQEDRFCRVSSLPLFT